MGIVKESESDETLMDCIEAAVAAHRRRTQLPDYVEPKVYAPKSPSRFRPDYDDPNQLTVERAFDWMDKADAYARDRLNQPSVNASQLMQLWEEHYKFRYALMKEPFPAERLAKFSLGLLQWHDLFNRTKGYLNSREFEGENDDGQLAPYGMLFVLAKKYAKNKDASHWRRNKAVVYLNRLQIFVGHLTMEQRAEVKQQYIDAHKYPRTYL